MSEPLPDDCCGCGRYEEASGPALRVEDAIDGKGEAQAYRYLRTLEAARKPRILERYAALIYRLETYADTGALDIPRELRKLTDEVWEIKTAEDRLPFYATSHDGAKEGTIARLTHGFEKRFGKTAEGRITGKQLNLAKWIVREDKKR